MGGERGSRIAKRFWVGDKVEVIAGRYVGSKGVVIERDGSRKQTLIYHVKVEFYERSETMVKDQKRTKWMSARHVEIIKHAKGKRQWDRRCAEKIRDTDDSGGP